MKFRPEWPKKVPKLLGLWFKKTVQKSALENGPVFIPIPCRVDPPCQVPSQKQLETERTASLRWCDLLSNLLVRLLFNALYIAHSFAYPLACCIRTRTAIQRRVGTCSAEAMGSACQIHTAPTLKPSGRRLARRAAGRTSSRFRLKGVQKNLPSETSFLRSMIVP